MPVNTPVRRNGRPAPPTGGLATATASRVVGRQSASDDSGGILALLSDPRVKEQMGKALPSHVTAERLARIAMTEVRKNPDLLRCDKASFLGAVMQACALGLEPGINGACYLIPYKETCTFVPGWKGLVDLVSRTGRASVWTGAVFEGDEFDYALGDRPFVHHRPGEEIDPEKLAYVYAIGRVNGSEFPVIEVWTMPKVWRHRDKINKQGQKHYSYRHPEMYARKVVLLQVLKYLPSSAEMTQAMELQRQEELGSAQDLPLNHLMSTPADAAPPLAPAEPVQPAQVTVVAQAAPAPAAAAPAPAPVAATAAAPAPAAAQAAPGGVQPSEAVPRISPDQVATIQRAMSFKLSPIGMETLAAELAVNGIDRIEAVPVALFDRVMQLIGSAEVCKHWNKGDSSEGQKLLSQERINEVAEAAAAAQAAETEQEEGQAAFV
jgi:recombination protein RecT